MEDHDLELAKLKLIQENLSLVIAKNGKVIFETEKQGIGGFLQAIETRGKQLDASSVADKIIGVATAKLCVYSNVASVFALTISEGGVKVLEDNNITYFFEKKVLNIMNRDKTDVCPFEKKAIGTKSPDEAYNKLKALATEMKRRSATGNC
jgi:hypothetical protein